MLSNYDFSLQFNVYKKNNTKYALFLKYGEICKNMQMQIVPLRI